jgi:hypothetical protein
MSDDSTNLTDAAREEDHWPTFDITPKAYEEAVAAIATSMNLDVVGGDVQHLDPVAATEFQRGALEFAHCVRTPGRQCLDPHHAPHHCGHPGPHRRVRDDTRWRR